MTKELKISRLAVVFNIFTYTLIASNICFSSIVMKKTGYSAWIVYLIYALFCFIIFFFYKPNPNYNISDSSIIVKLLIYLYVILKIAVILYITTTIISIWFYPKTDQFIFIIIFYILICFIASRKDYIILGLGVILGIGLVLFFLTALSMKTPHNFGLLKPFEMPDKNFFKVFYLLMLPLDNVFYLFFQDSYQKPLNKWHLIIPTLLAMLISALTIIDAYTIVTYEYYQDLYMPSITRYFLHTGDQYFQHLDLILAYITFALSTYKSAFFLKTLRKTINNQNKTTNAILYIAVIFSFTVTFILVKDSKLLETLLEYSSILIVLISIFILYGRKKTDEKQLSNKN